MSNVYQSYLNTLATARHSYSPRPDTSRIAELLKKMDTHHSLLVGANGPVVFLLDLPEQKYLSMSPSVLSISGYSSRYIMEGGLEMAISNYHPDDGRIYFGNIFFKNMEVLQQLTDKNRSDYCFSYNYRFKTKPGAYRSILQKLVILQSASDGTPLLMLILATDITHYKPDSRIIHTIEQLSGRQPRIMYSKTHFTEDSQFQLSFKEKEILKWIADGLSSKAIAEKLRLSIHTVYNHRKNILEKTNCSNAAELLQHAIGQGLL